VKNILPKTGTTFDAASHSGSRLFPPAPLTGDAGRGCGDASCAPLFVRKLSQTAAFAAPPFEIGKTYLGRVPKKKGNIRAGCATRAAAIARGTRAASSAVGLGSTFCHGAKRQRRPAKAAVPPHQPHACGQNGSRSAILKKEAAILRRILEEFDTRNAHYPLCALAQSAEDP
jgi:hypothetical protein